MAIFFAHRTEEKIKYIGIVIAAYILIVGMLAWFLPENSTSYSMAFSKWFVDLLLFVAALLFYLFVSLALEWTGTTFLSLPFWERMPSSARVTLLVVIIVIAIIAIIVIKQSVIEQNAL